MAFGQQCLLAVLGLSAGLSVASGVFTVFTAVGLVPRFAEHTKTAGHILTYENAIILGCFLGNLFSLFAGLSDGVQPWMAASGAADVIGMGASAMGMLVQAVLGCVGIFTGIYVGTLALSIAEMLDALPIMAHRMGIKRGLSFVITGLAVGKLIGSFFYYMHGVYAW